MFVCFAGGGAKATKPCHPTRHSNVIAHAQVVEDGYQFFASRQLVTVFSAPNYCGEFDNSGAIMSINEDLCCSFQILKASIIKRYE